MPTVYCRFAATRNGKLLASAFIVFSVAQWIKTALHVLWQQGKPQRHPSLGAMAGLFGVQSCGFSLSHSSLDDDGRRSAGPDALPTPIAEVPLSNSCGPTGTGQLHLYQIQSVHAQGRAVGLDIALSDQLGVLNPALGAPVRGNQRRLPINGKGAYTGRACVGMHELWTGELLSGRRGRQVFGLMRSAGTSRGERRIPISDHLARRHGDRVRVECGTPGRRS